MDQTLTADRNQRIIYAMVLLLVIVGGLIVYKANAALGVIQKTHVSGTMQPRTNVVPIPGTGQINVVARSINYFGVIWPALLFGILISAAVRVLNPPQWLSKSFGDNRVRSQLIAGLAGAPLMLCSCCVAPVFSGVYERSSRLGPSLAVLLAAPSLNPAALVLTFMLFDYRIGLVRVAMALLIVFLTGLLIERFVPVAPVDCPPFAGANDESLLKSFLRSVLQVAVRTLPLIVVGVLVSMAIAFWLPLSSFTSAGGQFLVIMLVALIAIPVALPTFFEIPLALIMLAAGAPAGAAVALMIAGPAVNLPSLFTIARSTNWRVAAWLALSIFVLAVAGGVLVGFVK
jgi:uncharacterized protein